MSSGQNYCRQGSPSPGYVGRKNCITSPAPPGQGAPGGTGDWPSPVTRWPGPAMGHEETKNRDEGPERGFGSSREAGYHPWSCHETRISKPASARAGSQTLVPRPHCSVCLSYRPARATQAVALVATLHGTRCRNSPVPTPRPCRPRTTASTPTPIRGGRFTRGRQISPTVAAVGNPKCGSLRPGDTIFVGTHNHRFTQLITTVLYRLQMNPETARSLSGSQPAVHACQSCPPGQSLYTSEHVRRK